MKLEKVLYTAKAKTTGGRDGSSQSDDGNLKVSLTVPKGLGGNGAAGTNPEQLFAAGYSSCFIGALKAAAGELKTRVPNDTFIEASVDIGPVGKAFGLAVRMNVVLPGLTQESARALVDKAHQICPYSNATRGNIDVSFTVQVG